MLNRKAQSALEYTVLLALIVASLLAMRVYIKRGFQGGFRNAIDQVSEKNFYSPGATEGRYVLRNTIQEVTRGEDEITTNNSTLEQGIVKEEGVLPYVSEPRRW